MKFKREEELLNQLKDLVDKNLSSKNSVALDADGTLWPEDANNILLRYQQKQDLCDLSELLDPYYNTDNNRYKRCEKFALAQEIFLLSELREQCKEALTREPLHVFPFQKKLLSYLKEKGMRIYIVTASLQWLVEEAVKIYNIPVDGVLGVKTRLDGDKICAEILKPAPLSSFKGDAFLKYNQGEPCFLAGGNTLTDLPLLKMADVAFVVHSALKDHQDFHSEEQLKQVGIKNNWIVFENL